MKTKRITKGIYEIQHNGRVFEVENLAYETGGSPDWNLYEMVNGSRDWWNDYATKADAKAAIVKVLEK